MGNNCVAFCSSCFTKSEGLSTGKSDKPKKSNHNKRIHKSQPPENPSVVSHPRSESGDRSTRGREEVKRVPEYSENRSSQTKSVDASNPSLTSDAYSQDQKIDYEAEAKKYEEQKSWNLAIDRYSRFYHEKKQPNTLYKLSQLYIKVQDYEKAAMASEDLIKTFFKSMDRRIDFPQMEENKDTFYQTPAHKIYQDAIDSLKKLAESSLDVGYLDKAIAYARDAQKYVQSDRDSSQSLLDKSGIQVPDLLKLRKEIEKQSKIEELEKFQTKILRIFDKKEDESDEDFRKVQELRELFEEEIEQKRHKIEQQYDENRISRLKQAPPNYFECIITCDLMEEPTAASDSHTYERQCIVDQIEKYSGRSPKTQEELNPAILYPNKALKKAIMHFEEM